MVYVIAMLHSAHREQSSLMTLGLVRFDSIFTNTPSACTTSVVCDFIGFVPYYCLIMFGLQLQKVSYVCFMRNVHFLVTVYGRKSAATS